MAVQFNRVLFVYFILAFVVLAIYARATHDSEGKACVTPSGESGVCLQLPQCPRAVDAITRGIRNHTRCGFIAATELVCCIKEPLNVDTTNRPPSLQSSTLSPPTTLFTESSTRGSYLLPPSMDASATPTANPTTSVHEDSSSTTVDYRENAEEDSENEVEDVNLDISRVNTDDIADRIFLGNNGRNRISPTLFAFNTLTGFVNAILGKPPTTRPFATKPPRLLRPVTIAPAQATTPIHILHNERVSTRKPGGNYVPTMFPLPSTTLQSILNLPPNEILTYKPKRSQTPVGNQNSTSSWHNTYSTHSPGDNSVKPEYPFITKPFPVSGSATEKPLNPVSLASTEKSNTDETTVLNVLSPPTHSSSEHTLNDNVQTSSPETPESITVKDGVLEISTSSVRPFLEPAPTEVPVWLDSQSAQPEVPVTPGVPFVTPIAPENLDFVTVPSENILPEDGEFTTTEVSPGPKPSSEKPVVGRKSQEACARYREIPKLTRYIVGGDFAAHGEFPHMVALGFQRPRQPQLTWMCGGTLLNEEYVLTAAHCVVTRFGGPVAVRVGYTNLTADVATGQEVALRGAFVHPGYNAATRAHDIALLRLATPLSYSQFVHPACLHPAHAPPPGTLLVTGWGSITPDGSTPTDHLRRATVIPIEDITCREAYPTIFRLEMICAGGDGVDTCKGDSGGPMQYLENSTSSIYTVVGVTSFGPNPCASGRPGVYSRVAGYLPWIEGVVWPN